MKDSLKVIIAIIIVVFLGYIFGSIYVMGNDYVDFFGYTYFLVGSGSMSPTINSDDVVIVRLNNKYDVNDIVTYYDGHNYVTHRIISRDMDNYILRGDYNKLEDKVIDKSNIIGKVVFVFKDFGKYKKVFTSIRVVIPLIITIVLFVLLFSYRDGYKRFRMRKIHYKKEKKTRKKRASSKKREKKV